MTRKFLIDTDTASDDAVALVMALREPTVTVEAVTVVAGNVPLDQAVQNAVYTVELCGSEVPVYAGRHAPLMRDLQTAEDVHGKDGMGNIGLPLSGRDPAGTGAIDVIIETIIGSPGKITLVTLGPLTNVAIALLREPGIADAVEHCYVMGGAGSGPGNVTQLAEFNFWADPEAARLVMRSGMPLTQVGWDISVASATFDAAAATEMRACGPLGEFSVDIQAVLDTFAREVSGVAGFDLADPMAMAVAIDPSIATSERLHVAVLIGDDIGRGKDVIDWHGVTGLEPNVDVVTRVPRETFVEMLHRLLTG